MGCVHNGLGYGLGCARASGESTATATTCEPAAAAKPGAVAHDATWCAPELQHERVTHCMPSSDLMCAAVPLG